MEICPYCGVYWDYINNEIKQTGSISISEEYFQYLTLKEQTEITKHVAYDHSTILLAETLQTEIEELKKSVKELGI